MRSVADGWCPAAIRARAAAVGRSVSVATPGPPALTGADVRRALPVAGAAADGLCVTLCLRFLFFASAARVTAAALALCPLPFLRLGFGLGLTVRCTPPTAAAE